METYGNQSLAIIKESQILRKEDWENLDTLKEELHETFVHSQVFRTRTEMEASVLNDIAFPTPDSKYHQATREQNVMFQELVFLSYEYRKNNIEILILKRDKDKETDELKKELMQIDIEKKEFIAINFEKTAKDRIREINEWHNIKETLKPTVVTSTIDANEHQLVSYTVSWIRQVMGMSDNVGLADRNNLFGKLDKAFKLCREGNCMDKILLYFPDRKTKEYILGLEKQLKSGI